MGKNMSFICDGCDAIINTDDFIVQMKVQETRFTSTNLSGLPVKSNPTVHVDEVYACRSCWDIMNLRDVKKLNAYAEERKVED